MSLETELEKTKLRWIEARKKGDMVMCSLWEKVGKSIKYRIELKSGTKKLSDPPQDSDIENIFGGKLDNG